MYNSQEGDRMIVNETAVKNILEEVKPAKLVAATKYVDEKEIENLEACGCMYYGENRVQAFLDKYELYHGKGHWHFIGTLQSNKVKYIIDKVELIHSVNTIKLIKEIEKQAAKHDLVSHVLLEVNIADEESKQGFDKNQVREAMDLILTCPHIVVDGLMMMAPNIEVEATRVYFKKTKALLDELKKEYPNYPLKELSMGMSQDYKVALEEGATIVRIGRALFKDEQA
ncbi:MAG: YggS family pyridoxal phosphate-dependent enzyme [Erysipelotrichaceae bacterium]|nr:YggS family pyridoxal phosphate-dependent enzyme [Erysipelotrichaceae bacterium]